MSTSVVSSKPTSVQKVCTLWTHDENFSKEDVVYNAEKFPELPSTPGSLLQILALNHATAVRDFQATAKSNAKENGSAKNDNSGNDTSRDTHSRRSRKAELKITIDENGSLIRGGRDVDPEKSYIFLAKPMPADLKSKHPNLQVCLD
jgi:hypothetical protein